MDDCLICGRQLEYAHHGNKKFCDECRKTRYNEIHRLTRNRYFQNPENRKKRNAQGRIYYRRRRSDPEYRKKLSEYALKWARNHREAYNKICNLAYHRRMKNPEYRKLYNERRRKYDRETYRRKKLGLPPLGLVAKFKPQG
jgi:hypothetical protein